jgi:hypothetical protein
MIEKNHIEFKYQPARNIKFLHKQNRKPDIFHPVKIVHML